MKNRMIAFALVVCMLFPGNSIVYATDGNIVNEEILAEEGNNIDVGQVQQKGIAAQVDENSVNIEEVMENQESGKGNPNGEEIEQNDEIVEVEDKKNASGNGIKETNILSTANEKQPIGTVVETGKCGDHLSYFIIVNGQDEENINKYKLLIEGTGEMYNYRLTDIMNHVLNTPWNQYKLQINELILTEGITKIGDYAFAFCEITGELSLPNSLCIIGEGAFEWCDKLTGNLFISNNVKSIGKKAFSFCTGLNGKLSIPESVTSIGEEAFSDCSSLTGDLIIPESIQVIEYGTFGRCRGFNGQLKLPESMISIGVNAFVGCSGLTGDLNIPEKLKVIEHGTFWGCSGFDGVLNISESVSVIEDRAFAGCSSLTGNLYIPSSVTRIEEMAFNNCSSLTGNLYIPDSVTSIGNSAFRYCNSLTGNLHLPNGIKDIGQYAFADCDGLTGDLRIPNSLECIRWGTFSNCEGLNGNLILSYNLKDIEDYAFENCNSLTGDVIIPESVEDIGTHAFDSCSGFDGKLIIPDNVKNIGMYAFVDCSGLTGDLSIPKEIETIENGVFLRCSGFKKLNIHNQVTSIGSYAFKECVGLRNLYIPESVTEIGEYAFADCHNLTGDLMIPKGVKSINNYSFADCWNMTGNLYIPNSVTEIGRYAFSDCKFKDIFFSGDYPNIKEKAFEHMQPIIHYPLNNVTWENKLNDKEVDAQWRPWLPDDKKISISVPLETEHMSGVNCYESKTGKSETIVGDKVIKDTTWEINGNTTMRSGTLYIRSGATVTVTGSLDAETIIVEKGGKLEVSGGGKIDAINITANGGWVKGIFATFSEDSGGKIWVKGGALEANELNFEGTSTLLIQDPGKIIVNQTMNMATNSDQSNISGGTLYICGKLNLSGNKKNFVADGAGFSTVFCGNTDGALSTETNKYNLGTVCVVKEDAITALALEDGNYFKAMLCRVNQKNWTVTKIGEIATLGGNSDWSKNVELAFSGVAAQSAFISTNNLLSAEENRLVESVAAIWINTLNAPLCDGFIELGNQYYALEFEVNGKNCLLEVHGSVSGFSSLASVLLTVTDGEAELMTNIGVVAKADVGEFSDKAQRYLTEEMKKEFIKYASGGLAGIIASKNSHISKDIVEKFIKKICETIFLDKSILQTNNIESVENLRKTFNVINSVMGKVGKSSNEIQRADSITQGVVATRYTSDNIVSEPQDAKPLVEVGSVVTDPWLKIELINVLGEDENGEPILDNAPSVTTLDLSGGYIQNLDGLQYFTNLTELDLSNNELTDLSPIAGLTKLEILDVSGQYLNSLTPIASLKNLRELNVSDNELSSLSSISNLASLQKLDVSGNNLITLQSLESLSGLQDIDLADNPIADGNLRYLSGMNQLSILNVSGCGLLSLSGIPVESLTELYVAYNHLNDLSMLSGASQLIVLDTAGNDLTDINMISHLKSLRQLSLAQNDMVECSELENLTGLIDLNLSHTGITETDLDILTDMEALENLDISENLIFGLNCLLELDNLKQITVTDTALGDADIARMEEKGIYVIDYTVLPTIKEMYFMTETISLDAGETYWQRPIFYPNGAELTNAIWTSSDESVAVVDEAGVVTGRSGGSTVISLTDNNGVQASYTVEVSGGQKGDINEDGYVNITDLMICLHHVSGRTLLDEQKLASADIDGNGSVNITDLMRMLHYVSGRTETL